MLSRRSLKKTRIPLGIADIIEKKTGVRSIHWEYLPNAYIILIKCDIRNADITELSAMAESLKGGK